MALKPAADGPDSLSPGSATSRNPWWGRCPVQAASQGEVKLPKIAKQAQGRRGT
ncbi:hypothetical protein KUCAC02_024203 [Chaenocephalus aceratus]|uniref:Uncharacterized protein n=1 Tax=Chaenocephalus aceratus TaxID=36190 RepID=A0ACB9WI21_CHAAC|nr:hypothetical protein KUCAC02_024203 [Chaenocephalus aceratus]